MKLTLEQIREITHGALSVAEENGAFVFRRFTEKQAQMYETINDFRVKVPATSGVRLEFLTDADSFSFDYRIDIASSRRFYFFDVFVDGVMVQHFGHENIRVAESTLTVKLTEGEHRVAIYLPCLAKATLSNVTVSDGATLKPVTKSRRLGQILVKPKGARDDPRDLRNLQGVRQTCAIMVACRCHKNLCLVHQAAEGLGMNDAVAVSLKFGSNLARTAIIIPPPGIGR